MSNSFRIQMTDLSAQARTLAAQVDTGAAGIGEEDIPAIKAKIAALPATDPAIAIYNAMLDGIVNGSANVPRDASTAQHLANALQAKTPWLQIRNLSADDLKGANITERGEAIGDILDKKGFHSWWEFWLWLPLPPFCFIWPFIDNNPWAGILSDTKDQKMIDILNSTPAYEKGALYRQLEASGMLRRLEQELSDPNERAAFEQFRRDAVVAFDTPAAVVDGLAMLRPDSQLSQSDLIEEMAKLRSVRGDDFATAVMQELKNRNELQQILPFVYRSVDPNQCTDTSALTKSPRQLYNEGRRGDEDALKAVVGNFPYAAQQMLNNDFETAHSWEQFNARFSATGCDESVVRNAVSAQGLADAFNALRQTGRNDAEINQIATDLRSKFDDVLGFMRNEPTERLPEVCMTQEQVNQADQMVTNFAIRVASYRRQLDVVKDALPASSQVRQDLETRFHDMYETRLELMRHDLDRCHDEFRNMPRPTPTPTPTPTPAPGRGPGRNPVPAHN